MTTREKIFGIIAAVVLVLAVFIGYEWFQEHDAAVQAQAKSSALETIRAANAQVIDQARKDFAQASADQARVADNLQQQLDRIAAQRRIVPTPAQIVIDTSKLIPGLPAPLKVEVAPATATAPATESVVIPKEDLAALHNYELDCEAKGLKLTACQQSSSDDGAKILDLTTEVTKTGSDLQLMKQDRDNWRNAAKGGTKWHRTLTAAKWIAAGAVIGYVAGRNF